MTLLTAASTPKLPVCMPIHHVGISCICFEKLHYGFLICNDKAFICNQSCITALASLLRLNHPALQPSSLLQIPQLPCRHNLPLPQDHHSRPPTPSLPLPPPPLVHLPPIPPPLQEIIHKLPNQQSARPSAHDFCHPPPIYLRQPRSRMPRIELILCRRDAVTA